LDRRGWGRGKASFFPTESKKGINFNLLKNVEKKEERDKPIRKEGGGDETKHLSAR